MRILHVTPFYPPSVGGMEVVVESLSRKLVDAGHQVTVFTSNVPQSIKQETIQGIEIYRFRSWFGPLNNQFTPGLFFKLLKERSYDVVHVHSHVFLADNMTAFTKIFTRLPMVLTSHGAIPGYRGIKHSIEAVYNATAGKWTLRAMDRIIAVSPSQADILENLGARRKDIRIIPSGFDLSQFHLERDSQEFKTKYSIGGRKTILFVGTLIPRKGIEYLIEAVSYSKFKPLLLLVGGEIPGFLGHQKYLEEKTRRFGVEKDVLFLGHFTREKLEPAYLASDLFAFPSLIEGLPLVLLEAMFYGKGIVATDIPGNCDAIKDGVNGLLCQPRDARDLSRKIDILLDNPELRQRFGAEARKDALSNYGWDSVLKKITDVYDEIGRHRVKEER